MASAPPRSDLVGIQPALPASAHADLVQIKGRPYHEEREARRDRPERDAFEGSQRPTPARHCDQDEEQENDDEAAKDVHGNNDLAENQPAGQLPRHGTRLLPVSLQPLGSGEAVFAAGLPGAFHRSVGGRRYWWNSRILKASTSFGSGTSPVTNPLFERMNATSAT